MDSDRDVELLSHFWLLHAAILRRDGIESRLRTDAADEDLRGRSLSAAEGLLAARSGLFRYLMAQGWTPPESVLKALRYDETVLSQGEGAVPG